MTNTKNWTKVKGEWTRRGMTETETGKRTHELEAVREILFREHSAETEKVGTWCYFDREHEASWARVVEKRLGHAIDAATGDTSVPFFLESEVAEFLGELPKSDIDHMLRIHLDPCVAKVTAYLRKSEALKVEPVGAKRYAEYACRESLRHALLNIYTISRTGGLDNELF